MRKCPRARNARAGCLTKATTMTENASKRFEPDASDHDHPPITNAREDGETVHSTDDWELTVLPTGSVEATKSPPGTGINHWATRGQWSDPTGNGFQYELSIEQLLARYAHETRFERDPNEGEHGAALRNGIINALQSVATDATCTECEERATHIEQVNAPGNVRTGLLCHDHAEEMKGRYVTLYALDSATEAEP
jgi:hypothetical protein